jgi:hypothetical protein
MLFIMDCVLANIRMDPTISIISTMLHTHILLMYHRRGGHAVAQLVQAPRYKSDTDVDKDTDTLTEQITCFFLMRGDRHFPETK